MKFRKFVAASTRDCLRMMREALGADAMIVSTRRTTSGVEVVGIRAQDMPIADDGPIPAESAPEPQAAEPAGALWDDMEDEPVRLSPAARVLASQKEERASDVAPPVKAPAKAAPKAPAIAARIEAPADPAELPLARWPRVQEAQIPHLVRAGRDQSDAPPAAAAGAAGEDGKAVPKFGVAQQVNAAVAPPAAAPVPAPAPALPAAARIDENDRAELVIQVSDPIVSEMRSMRTWLGRQMDAMAWRDSMQRQPLRRDVWRRMVDSGFTPELARTVASRLPVGHDPDQAAQWLADALVRNLACIDAADSLIERGGRYAIVGPTGVGKTTTTAKIAAHCVVKYGAGSLGLISTDQNRIGAMDQLHTFGRMLGVEVYAARGANDLEVLLASMADRRLVLIDSAGLSQRDAQISRHLDALSVGGVERVLVVPGGSHAEQAEDIVRAYSAGGLAGMIVSKIDEAVRLGGVLDAAIRHRLPLHYMTNGQRVPEDIHAANALLLVHRALRVRNAPVFALDAEELDWACEASTDGDAVQAAGTDAPGLPEGV
ncbi:Flagellar biosynthesis protein FlhF [Pigmentiphaga humi]|uniref:Flagellar biosynthesis protein FlhF n=1 Tax=Pigmentiphaga humi TaxID=2478468 RepID=A0A3P4B202_9BURK|nr:flagellar biosynthesis protein FlhF [Pigmentiphaga humi]VCU69911.1 Flagellar biosynthesis protein FlhF [Pigmentiphaga humi]